MTEKDQKEIWDKSLYSNKLVFKEINVKRRESNDSIKFNNLSLDDLIANYVKTPRELNLIAMATSNSWIRCNKLICCRDLIALEILKKYEKQHYLNLCDVADEFDFKKYYFRINTYNLQDTLVANAWYKGATALSMSFENPCLMVLYINGYENFKKGCELMLRRTFQASHLKETSIEANACLVKALILDLMDNCEDLLGIFYNDKYSCKSGYVPSIINLDYFIDNAMMLIKGEIKNSETFYNFINYLIDILIDLDSTTLTEKLGITDNDEVLKPLLDDLQSWIGRAICDIEFLNPNKTYAVLAVLYRLKVVNSTKHLGVIYSMFKWLTDHNYPLYYIDYMSCASLLINIVKLSISNGDLFNIKSCYEILRECKNYFNKIKYDLDTYLELKTSFLTILALDIEKVEYEIINELRDQIDHNECMLHFYLSCATYLNVPYDFHSLGNEIYQEKLQNLSDEFDNFLKFYNLDPKMIYEQLRKLERMLIDNDKEHMYSDIHNLIEIINRKHKFSSSEDDQEGIK